MVKARPGYAFWVLAVAVAAIFAFSAVDPSSAAERKSLRLATSQVGTYGYQVATLLSRVIEEALNREYTVTVQPYTSPTVAMKAVMDGNGEISYTADIGMAEFHQRVGGFKGYKPKVTELVHSWYSYPMESMMGIAAKDAEKFKCWRDFSGKPVFFSNAGFMNWLNYMRVFKILGYNFKHVQIDLKANADAMESGSIVGSGVYTTAGRSLPAYWKETEIRMDVRVVNPSPDELAKIRAAGLTIVEVDPKAVFSKSVGPSPLMGVAILFGHNVGTNISEDVVYKMLTAFYKKKDELAKGDPGFTPLAKDFVGLQVQGISANPEVPVHPGLVKFLKEQKAWNAGWKVAGSK